jgi:MFS family permease
MIYSTPIRLLLLASFILTAGRALTLPFLAIYLLEAFSLRQTEAGLLLTASLTLATLVGLYGGYLVDKSDKLRLILVGVVAVAVTAALLPVARQAGTALLVLTIGSAAGSLIDIAIKSCFAQLLAEQERLKAFSARYLVNNIAYSIGPLAGMALLTTLGKPAVFYSSGLLCLLALVPAVALLRSGVALPPANAGGRTSFTQALRVMRSDRQLLAFTAAGALCALVYGRFSAYLSQYLAVVLNAEAAYHMMALLITTNALVVIGLQYPIGSRLRHANILLWQSVASLLLVCALLGFMVSTALPVWIVAMVAFTLGEIIAVAASYLFIDHIAPEHMKGSYYAAGNMSALGSAASPLMCGVLLESALPSVMFWVLIACVGVSMLLYVLGMRLPARASVLTVSGGNEWKL